MKSAKFYISTLACLMGFGLLTATQPGQATPFGNYASDNAANNSVAAPKRAPNRPITRQPNADQIIKRLSRAPRPGAKPKRRTLGEVKRSYRLRRRLHSVDIDTINFRYDSAQVDPSQAYKLRELAIALKRMTRRRPYEVFLIEGHTDAPGTYGYNQTLSLDRARAVKSILVNRFGVTRRAIETAGYGEQYLKVPVDGPERVNRRVTVRRITEFVDRNHRPYTTARPSAAARVVPYKPAPRTSSPDYHPDEWKGPRATYPRRYFRDYYWD